MVITNFTYSLPTDVDYIRAGDITSLAGVNQQAAVCTPDFTYDPSSSRLQGQTLQYGGIPANTKWKVTSGSTPDITYVPTKMQIQVNALPVISRNDISNNFSLNDYASGKLLKGIQNVRGGFW